MRKIRKKTQALLYESLRLGSKFRLGYILPITFEPVRMVSGLVAMLEGIWEGREVFRQWCVPWRFCGLFRDNRTQYHNARVIDGDQQGNRI